MNTRKDANNLFLTVVLLSLLANIAVSYMSVKGVKLNIGLNLILSQLIIFVPGLIFLLVKNKDEVIYNPFCKIKLSTVILLVIFTWFLMPLTSCANIFSQLFTTNEVMNISGEVLDLPFLPTVIMMGIIGPFSEEFVFRGLIYNGLKGKGERYIAAALLSGLFFGLMHMNFNQFCYGFVLGVLFAVINECLGSLWASFICHAVVNTQNVVTMFVMDNLLSMTEDSGLSELYNNAYAGAGPDEYRSEILIMFGVLLVVSIISTAVAGCILYGICMIEGKTDRFKRVFKLKRAEEEYKTRLLYFSGIAAISICIFVMFLLEPVVNAIK